MTATNGHFYDFQKNSAIAGRGASERAAAFFRGLWSAAAGWATGTDEAPLGESLAQSGGRLTDNFEREMFQRWAASHSNFSV